MRSLILTLALAASVFLPAAGSAQECLSSAKAVRAAHGVEAWSTYKTIDGRKCWMEGVRPDDRRTVSGDGTRHHRNVADRANVIPLPRERPAALSASDALPRKPVWTVKAPALAWPDTLTEADKAVEPPEAATAKMMNVAWTDGFAPQEPASFRNAVLTETIVVPPKPLSVTAWDWLILLLGPIGAAVVFWLPRRMGRAMAAAGI